MQFETIKVPLNKLELSDHNVRTNVADATDVASLAASIFSLGLLYPLIVTPKGKTKYQVHAGGRRLRALEALAAEGKISKTEEVACVVQVGGSLEEISLAENYSRKQLRPYEVWRAFHSIKEREPELTIEQLGERFGLDAGVMKRTLRMASVHPEIFKAFAAGEIREDVVMAYASNDDQALQFTVWQQMQQAPHQAYASQIKRAMGFPDYDMQRRLSAIGRDAYEAAGGALDKDLFSEDVRIVHPEILQRLWLEKLEATRKELVPEGVPVLDKQGAWADRWEPAKDFTPEEEAEIATLTEQGEALPEDEEYSDRLLEIEARIDTIEMKAEARSVPTDGSVAAFITNHHDGTMGVAYYRTDAAPTPEKAKVEKPKASGLTAEGVEVLGTVRRILIRDALDANLAVNGQVGLDFLLWSQAKAVLTHAYPEGFIRLSGFDHAGTAIEAQACAIAELGAGAWTQLEMRIAAMPFIAEDDPVASFRSFIDLDLRDKNAVATYLAGAILKRSPSTQPLPIHAALYNEAIETGHDERAAWAPSEAFMALYRKGQIVEMVERVAGEHASIVKGGRLEQVRQQASRLMTCSEETQKLMGIDDETASELRSWKPEQFDFSQPEKADG